MKNHNFLLVTLDFDYTTFLGNSMLFLNKVLGISEKLEEYHADYRNGKISEKELNIKQNPILQKISLSKAYETLAKGPILKRLDMGVNLLRNQGIDVQMLTLNPFQLFFTNQYGIKSDISLLCEVQGDHLGETKEIPDNKVDLLKRYCVKNGIDLVRCAHVGDGQNDIETFRTVGFSIALNTSDPNVEREASVLLKTRDFTDVANTILHASNLA
ncbi:MAG: HAD hydrolase family protein [Nitrososphaerales archaeon]|jgi:phosphoserine phosphatase